jgi:hypothetical protein
MTMKRTRRKLSADEHGALADAMCALSALIVDVTTTVPKASREYGAARRLAETMQRTRAIFDEVTHTDLDRTDVYYGPARKWKSIG